MSYTNLAAMASEFENSSVRSILSTQAASGSSDSQPAEVLYKRAMELINTGLKLDLNNPMQASDQYQQGAELLSQALERADSGSQADEMQRTLDMVEERVRLITREAVGRTSSDSQLTTDKPSSPRTDADAEFKPSFASETRAPNYFDTNNPDELPHELREAVRLSSPVFKELLRQFGFQHESAHSQQEHLVMLLANAASHDGGVHCDVLVGLSSLHAKLLSNYRTWARQLGTTPQCAGESDTAANKTTDLALLMLIWGEAANLRHVPESLCYLFHKMRAELWGAAPHSVQRPQGWFLSRVIAPLYRHMRAEMNRKNAKGKPLGHTSKPNYDDFNEFFWSSECLKYRYHVPDEDDEDVLSVSAGLLRDTFLAGVPSGPPVSQLPAVKRYVERRSWLHPIRSFWRVHSFLLLMLHVLLALAFCERPTTGVAADAALAQALAGLPVTHGGLGVLRELLGIFAMHGMLHTHVGVLLSLLLRLSLKLGFTLVMGYYYQRMLLAAPFETLVFVPVHEWVHSTLLQHTTFCYAALVYCAPAVLSAVAQVFPCLSSWVRSWRGPMKSLVDAFEPLNRLLVGKDIHTPFSHKLPYDFYWVSLLALKFWFSYSFQIHPLVTPTRDIWQLDLSSWSPDPEIDLGKLPNVVVLVVRWGPLMLMYMIDLQLWFMLWTAMYGTVIGCNLHIGEVPDLPTVRDRFLLAAENFNRKVLSDSATLESVREKPHPLPEFARKTTHDAMKGAVRDGLGLALLQAGEHAESGDMRNESLRYFAEAWNAILDDMRMSDLLSNHELHILVFRCWQGPVFSRCTYLPIFCTAGKLNDAFNFVRSLSAEYEQQSIARRHKFELQLHTGITSDFEMCEALTEFCELTRWLLAGLLGVRHAAALQKVVGALTAFVANGEALDILKPANLPNLAKAVVDLAKAVLSIKLAPTDPDDPSAPPRLADNTNAGKVVDKVKSTLDTLKTCIGRAPKSVMHELETLKFTSSGLFWDDGYARATLAQLRSEPQCADKCNGIVTLCTTAQIDTVPEEFEVKRRLCWFVGSLFMDMPRPPPVSRMHSWTVMTPFYAEDLLYSAKELAAKTEDGVSMLIFLKTVHETEWHNFLERVGVGRTAAEEARLFTEKALLEELRLWASFRGQTLARTAEGMMLHERALRLLASWEGLRDAELEAAVTLKFSYVISAQAYGTHKKSRDLKAADTEFLLQRYPALRVAYVDKASTLTKVAEADGRATLKEAIRFYSVLIKGIRRDDGEAAVQEVFRVQLPGDIMLGEGKPENQNHAMIFTRGEALQTIDMNQCGYFEEALKMRNLLCEFRQYPGALPPTILGFREHIFTGTSKQLSSLASYMALQEGCFVTLTQRVLWKPLQVRLHYGHPDVFDKLFSMTRGGVSKASRGINLSEDIYAGFNHLLRGCTIPYIEYVQVGKGRDVGMQQIYKFEAKLASGNAEQCLSRDVYRIGQRLDFTRLLSFYYSGPGFYFNNACTVFAMFFFLYLQLWSHILQLDLGVPAADLLNAQWVLQLGLLLTVPILCYLAVEHGITHSLTKFAETFITGSPFFFMFHMGTKAHYYDSTLKYGGAKYRPTGRGFVLQHEDFAELFRFHAASHLYNGFELLWGLLLLFALGRWPNGAPMYWRTCWSLWAVMVSWLFAPFWFNPMAFDTNKTNQDLKGWLLWMRRKDASQTTSWEAWYEEEHTYLQTGSWLKRLHVLSPGVRYALTFVGLLAALSDTSLHEGVLKELKFLGIIVGGVFGVLLLLALLRYVFRHSYIALRVGSTLLTVSAVVAVPVVLSYLSLYRILLLLAACGYFLGFVTRVLMTIGKPRNPLCRLPMQAYDYLIGGLLLFLCLSLSVLQCCRQLQTKSLLSAVFERRIAHNEVMKLLDTSA